VTAAYDTRDAPADPTRGWLLSSNVEWSAGALGSNLRFVRQLTQGHRFASWGPITLGSAVRVGTASAFGGQVLIPSERFFSGGGRTVRGVRDDTLGPRDVLGSPTGGGALLVLNEEVRFPIYRWFRGVTFVDAGNVFASPSAMDVRQLAGSIGAGLRITTPVTLLRIDYARLWSAPAGARGARWSFGIGHTF